METKKTDIEKKENSISKIQTELKNLNISNLVEKSVKNRSIWKAEFLQSLSKKDKTARRMARNNFQIPLSEAIVKKSENKYNRPASMNELCIALHNFYKIALIDISKYSSMSETGKYFETVNKAYNLMKKELKLN